MCGLHRYRRAVVAPPYRDDAQFHISVHSRAVLPANADKFREQSCVRMLCVLDVRPRQLSSEQVGLLKDMAILVERELQQSGGAARARWLRGALLFTFLDGFHSRGRHCCIATGARNPGPEWVIFDGFAMSAHGLLIA